MNIFFTVVGSLIMILLSINGFFIVRYFKMQDGFNERSTNTFDKLNDSMVELNTTLQVFKEHQQGFEQGCRERHERLDEQLKKN
jgi:hypothetical protein